MFAVIRVRGEVGTGPDVRKTFELLRLHRKNNCVVVPEEKQVKKMIEKVKDYATFGEIDNETLSSLIKKRGRMEGDKRITDEALKELGFSSVEELSEALISGKIKVKDLNKFKKIFRLHPPKKGFERAGIKKPFTVGGALGYRGEKINLLIKKMI